MKLASGSVSFIHDIVLKHPVLNNVIEHVDLKTQMSMMLSNRQKIKFSSDSASSDSLSSLLSVETLPSENSNEIDMNAYVLPDEFIKENGCEVNICAVYYGPSAFYAQCIDSLKDYQNFQIKLRLRKTSLIPLKKYPPTLGNYYIAILEDNNIQRVVILSVDDNFIRVRLIDEGIQKLVKSFQLFETPSKLNEKPFAWKFSLSEAETLNHIDKREMNFYFQYITKDKKLKLRVDKKATREGNWNLNINLKFLIKTKIVFIFIIGELSLCTLFDGNQNVLDILKRFNPNELKYPAQVPLSTTNSYKVKISSFESAKHFYVNVLDDRNSGHRAVFEEFADFNSYNFNTPAVGSACCVVVHNVNYRGKVLKLLTPNIIACQLVDLGQIDDFSDTEVKIMIEKFTEIPPLAFKCTLHGFDGHKPSFQSIRIFKEFCERNESLTMQVVSVVDDQYSVTLITSDGKNVLEQLKSPCVGFRFNPYVYHRGTALVRRQRNSFRGKIAATAVQPLQISLNEDWTREERTANDSWNNSLTNDIKVLNDQEYSYGIITSVISPNKFTIQCKELQEEIKLFTKDLQKLGEDSIPLASFEESELCLAKNPFTNDWYRARIVDSNFDKAEPMITVENIDDGCTYTYDKIENLRKYPLLCLFKPYYGIKCSLPVRISKKNENVATNAMMHLIEKEIRYKIMAVNERCSIVEINSDGKNIADELAKADLAIRSKIIQNGKARVAHIEHLAKFYVHLDKELGKLDVLKDYSKTYEHLHVDKPAVDMLVVVKDALTNIWNRARIVSVNNDEIVAQLIDYGTTETFKRGDVGVLDPTLAMLEELGHCCALNLPSRYDPSSAVAIGRFKEIIKDKVVSIRMIKAEKHHSVVGIFIDEENILNELIPLCIESEVNESIENSFELDEDDSLQSNI